MWELLKREIKIFSIKYAKQLNTKKQCELIRLETELKSLDRDNLTPEQDARKDEIQEILTNLYNEKCKGTQVRARVKWLEESERNNKYFLSLENTRQASNVIEEIRLDNGETVHEQRQVLHEIGKFYKKLYTSTGVNTGDIRTYLDTISVINPLSHYQKESLELLPSLKELDKVVYLMKDNRSPGMDGLPAELYKTFWTSLKHVYLDMILESWQLEDLPFSMKTAILALIHKGDERNRLKHYRPISLLNSDYKIIAFVFAERLQKVLQSIIHSSQSGYIGGRYIGCNVRNLIDIYDICENENIPGALLTIDFEKAFDSIEYNFMYETLKKFNFGENFIKWISILYNEPIFRIKNNGWISQPYKMERGQRQGCPLSALIFIIIVEVLAIAVRDNLEIKGLVIGDVEHKIVQYADDATLILRDLQSIDTVITTINRFSRLAGPKLNVEKTTGIWLGPLKDLGLRKYCNITWTGKPIKCLGIYLGHDKDKCLALNWDKKLIAVKKVLSQWKQRASTLTLQGKILVVKTLALSKIVFPATLLTMPENVRKELKTSIFEFIWGKRDRLKRLHLVNDVLHGGLSMVEIESFVTSLKAAWVTKFITIDGDWKNVLTYHLKRLGLSIKYILKMNFKSVKRFPILANIPVFYQDVFTAFNKVKHIVPIHLANCSDLMEQPIFGNELFMCNDKCLYFKNWLICNIKYVKDLVDKKGEILTDDQIYNRIDQQRNILHEMFIIKNYVCKHIKSLNTESSQNALISRNIVIISNNKRYIIEKQKSNFFYNILKDQVAVRSEMEKVWCCKFNFESTVNTWKSVYLQKIKYICDNKLAEFNFKILHNIVPTGYNLSKWKYDINVHCEVCGATETMEHMLYVCPRISNMWKVISSAIKVNINWKNIVCGYIMCENSDKVQLLNLLYSIITYAVFKNNNNSKFEKKCYATIDVQKSVKKNIAYYRKVLLCQGRVIENSWQDKMFENIIEVL